MKHIVRKYVAAITVPAVILGLLALVFYKLGEVKEKAPSIESIHAEKGIPVKVAPVQRRDFTRYLYCDGDVLGHDRAVLRARIEDLVEEVRVRPGERVQEGQVLVVFRKADKEAAVQATEAAYEEARLKHERYVTLRKQGVVTEQDLERATTALETTAAARRSARTKLDYTGVTSPVDGVVAERLVEPGEYKASKDKLLSIVNLKAVDVRALVSEKHRTSLVTGMAGEFRLQSEEAAGRWFTGEVSRMSPTSDDPNRFFDVYLKVQNTRKPNPDGGWLILPGMYAEVRFTLGRTRDAVAVRSDAVRYEGGRRAVYAVEEDAAMRPVMAPPTDESGAANRANGGVIAQIRRGMARIARRGRQNEPPEPKFEEVTVEKARRVEVGLGLREGGMVEIQGADLSPGARVIVNPSDDIRDGSIVRIVTGDE